MEEYLDLLEMNYGIMVMDGEEICHVCLYKTPITDKDIEDLKKELAEDAEFELIDRVNSLEFKEAPLEIIEDIRLSILEDLQKEE